MLKNLIIPLLLGLSFGAHAGPFVDGQIPKASDFNAAFDAKTDNASAAITGGTINGASIGATTPSTGAFTALSAITANPSLLYQAAGTGAVARSFSAKFGDSVSVLDYGADPTGVADSTAAIQAAINDNPGKRIMFPKGTYLISAAITVPASNILSGDGAFSTVINVSGSGYDAFTFTLSGSGVSNIHFTSPSPRTSGYYLNFHTNAATAIQQNLVDKVFIQQGNGVDISGPNTTLTYILDSNFYGLPPSTGIGIWIEGGAGTIINNIQMDNPVASQPSAGILMTGGGGVLISKTDVVRSGIGLNVIPSSQGVNFLTVSDSEFDTCTNYAVNISPTGTGFIDSVTLNNVWSSASGVGINVNPTSAAGVNGLNIIAPRIFNNLAQGIYVGGTTFFTNIIGGQFGGNSSGASGSYAGIEFGSNLTHFNAAYNFVGQVAGGSNTQNYGIIVGSGASNYNISNNTLNLNLTGGLLNNGSGTNMSVCHNIGAPDQNCSANTAPLGLTAGSNVFYGGNLAGATIPGDGTANGYSTFGWNYSNGGGETDFINAKGAGSLGGFNWYSYDGTTMSNIMTLSKTGALTLTTANKKVITSLDTTAGQPAVAITVGASPFSYTAPYGGSVAISGGALSNVALSRGGVTVWNSALSADDVSVRAGDVVTVTYTVAPTMYQLSD